MAVPKSSSSAVLSAQRPVLIILELTGEKRRVSIATDQFTLGRKRCDVVFSDPKVSASHAVIEREAASSGTHFFIKDLNSTNGTFVNGTRVKRRRLEDNDLIQVGFTQLRFRESEVDAQQTQITDPPTDGRASEVGFLPSLRLEIGTSSAGGRTETIRSRNVLIGRSEASHIHVRLTGESISDEHALLQVLGDGLLFITDLSARGGVLVNGKPVSSARVYSGDRIRLGDEEITLTLEETNEAS